MLTRLRVAGGLALSYDAEVRLRTSQFLNTRMPHLINTPLQRGGWGAHDLQPLQRFLVGQ